MKRAAVLTTLVASLPCLLPSSTQAASYTWGGSNSTWTNTSASGWNGGPPAGGDSATINSGVVTINGLTIGSAIAINSGGTLVAFADSSVGGNVSLNGNLSGSGLVNKTGNFSLFLAGNNSGFSGTINATQSNLFLSADNSGSAAAAWVLSSGATLLNSPSQSGNRTYQLGSLSGTGGTLGNCLESGSGLVTFEIGGNHANTTYAGQVADTVWNTGTTAITKVGDGTLKLTAVSTYTGGTLVNDGTLELNSTSGDQSVIRGALTVNSGAAVNITGGDFAGLGRLNGANVTTLSVNGGTVNNSVQSWLTGATVNLTAGTMNGVGSHHLLNSSLNSKASAAASDISSALVIRKDYGSGDLSIDTEDGAAATDLLISGSISQAGPASGLSKTGAGTLVLTGAGTYGGLTSVNGGILQLGDGTSGHDGTLANTSGISIAGGASLAFHRFGNLTSGVPISGSGSVIKAGPGTQTLTGSNTYSGGTTVSGGTLVVDSAGTLGSGNVTANAGAVIEIRNPEGAIADVASIHLNGTGKLTLASGVTEVVGGLWIDGVPQGTGSYNAISLASSISGGGTLNVVAGTVLVSNPVPRQIIQRNEGNTGTIVISGTYSGTPDRIEARAVVMSGSGNSGTSTGWATIVTAPAGGSFSGTLTEVPAGGWYQIEVRSVVGGSPLSNIASVQRVGVGDIYVTAGQSNSANWGEPGVNTDDRVSAMNFSTGAWSMAADPMPGGDGPRGSVWTRLGTLLTSATNVPVGFVSVGVGSTAVSYWVPPATNGYLRLKAAAQAFPANGFRAVLWHQGENDSYISTTVADYQTRLSSAIVQLRTDAGWAVPWYVAEASDLGNTTLIQEEPVIAGQRRVIYGDPLVFAGPVTDDFHLEGKLFDGVHFNNAGMADHAQQWAEVLAGTPPLAPKNGDIESNTALADGGIAVVNMGDVSSPSALGWRIVNASGEAAADGTNGYFNPDASFYTAAVDGGGSGGVLPNMSGRNVAFLYGGSNGNHFLQTRRASLQANTTYTLSVALGVRGNTNTFGNARIELLADGVSLASRNITRADLDALNGGNAANTFTDVQLTHATGATVAAGQPLAIRISKIDGQLGGNPTYVDFDNVRLTSVGTVTTPGSIPYQAALDAAAVNLPDVADISKKGLLVGNGELNAIVYSSGNEIRLRVSKNDCWDMRINTSADPALPTVNAATQSFTGNQGSAPPSWTNYVHPTALPCTDIALAAAPGQTGWTSAKLDLAKAFATVVSNTDSTTVRVLSQSNVILIDSGRAASLGGVSGLVKDHEGNPISGWVSAANPGTQGGYTYLHQNIPGDADVSGMDIYIVSGASGTRRAIAVVTSRESSTPLADAVNLVTNTLADANAVATHEAAWQAFWSKSGVSLGDATLQNWWYRMVYFLRTFAKAGGNVIGLQAAFDTLGGWHNSLTLNYNAQQVYLAAGPINHPELIEPFVDVLQRNLNRAKWFAATNFAGSEGAYFHVNLWPFEPDPANCTTPNKHQHAYMPWGYSWGTNGHSAAVLWDYYKFKPGTTGLDRIYPVLEQFALFYCSMLEQCPLVEGKRRIGPSYFAEIGSYGVSNSSYDIVFIRFALKAAEQAARLKGNSVFADRCAANLATLPAYPTAVAPSQGGPVIGQWLGSGLSTYMNIGSEVMPLFPTDEVTWMSDAAERDLLARTIRHSESVTQHVNSNVTMNIARARLGLGEEAIANANFCFGPGSGISPEQANGLFYWKGHGYYLSEQVCIARFVSELLLQSAGDVIRLFPAWPAGKDGSFSRLLAQGGFEVSAERSSGVIQNVTLKSTVGGDARVSNPWTGYALNVVAQGNGAVVAATESNGIHTFPTTAGETYQLTQGAATAPPSTPTGLHPYAGNTTASLGWSAAPGAESYLVSRSTDGVNFAVIGTASGTGYVDTGLTNGATYHYKVRAANTIGESPDSPAVSVVPGGLNAISINFQGGSPNNGTPSAMASTESAGHVSASHWNTVPGAVGSASSLVQNNGSTSPAAVAWSGNNLWSTLVADTAGNNRMMKGYLDTTDTSTTSVNVSGLPAGYTSGGYEVYLYVDGQSNATDNKQGRYTLDGSLITLVDAASTDFSGAFTLANNGTGNCIVFTNRTTSGFTLTATANPLQPGGRAPLNGIQIVGSVAGGPPLAPAAPAANALSSTSVRITWTDAATDETAYVVEHSPAGANTWSIGPQMPSNSTESITSGLDAGTQYDFRIKSLGTGGVATSATVTIATLTAFEQWKQDNGIALAGADDEDPDGDGMTNSQEYAFGTDPQEASSFQAITSLPNPATGIFTYTRRKPSLTGLAYTVWTSTHLNDWAEDGTATQTVIATSGDVETVRVTLSSSLLSETRLFIRVQAQ